MKLPPLFNCSNDMALAANVSQYFPPKRIQQMEEDLRDLAQYWDEGPWGWSRTTKMRYRKMGISEENLPSDAWLDEVRMLSSREYACSYIKELLSEMNDDRLVGHEMKFCTNHESLIILSTLVALFTKNHPVVFKSPWSSSGRGVFTSHKLSVEQIEKKLQGFVNTQGGFVMDKFYDKEVDFAMEFYVHKNHEVEFLGYSVFHAEENGSYGYNYVESQERLKERIGIDEEILDQLADYHKSHLSKTVYHGPVGIDMLVCKPSAAQNGTLYMVPGICLHPCIEINLRMNMGILAILLYNKYGAEANVQLTPHREHGFEAKIEGGKLMITYNK